MNPTQLDLMAKTSKEMFEISRNIFWSGIPVAFLLSLLMIYASGQISSARIGGLIRRLLVAVALIVAMPQISSTLASLDHSLVAAFGGEETFQSLFAKIADHAHEVKNTGVTAWIKIGQMGLSIIATLSFMILSIIQKFLEILRITLWNLLHILGPLALLACPFPSFDQMTRGIFLGLLEISLWRPLWVILCRMLIAIGFGEVPTDLSNWFDLAIMNFAVAGLMASTPALVHGFLSGSLAGVGGTAIQSMAGGLGAALAGAPLALGRKALRFTKERVAAPVANKMVVNPARQVLQRMRNSRPAQNNFKQKRK